MTIATRVPRVSVCVPTYNRVELLDGALRTLRAQSFADFELLVVDNSSTDGTETFVASLGDPRLRYHRNDVNLGSRGNWNRCLDLASGEFVAICHDDDLYDPQFLARCVATLDGHPGAAFVHTAVRIIDDHGRPIRLHRAYPSDRVIPGWEAFVRYLALSHDVVMSSVVARRSCYEAVGRFTTDFLCADFEMWLKLALQGDVAYLAEPLVGYRTHHASTSLTMNPGRWWEENALIVRRAVGWAQGKIPGIGAREAELLASTRRVWARRTLKEALFAASYGHLQTAREYVRVSRMLGRGEGTAWLACVATVLLNPLGAAVLQGVRVGRRNLRRAH